MRIVFFSAALLASGLAAAATPVDGWYSSVFGGYSNIPDNISNRHFGIKRDHASYNGGYHAGARFGFQSQPLRYEAEFTYIHASIKKFRVFQIPQLGRIRQFGINSQVNAALGMANVYYDFPEMVPCISPFLGGGIGYGWVEARLSTRNPFFSTNFKGSNSVFAYQATAGLTYNFSENYALNIAYRYVGTERVHELGKIFQANLGTVGVIYRFDEASYK